MLLHLRVQALYGQAKASVCKNRSAQKCFCARKNICPYLSIERDWKKIKGRKRETERDRERQRRRGRRGEKRERNKEADEEVREVRGRRKERRGGGERGGERGDERGARVVQVRQAFFF